MPPQVPALKGHRIPQSWEGKALDEGPEGKKSISPGTVGCEEKGPLQEPQEGEFWVSSAAYQPICQRQSFR